MRILVCGGRDFTNRDLLFSTLYNLCDEFSLWYTPDEYGNTLPKGVTIIHGGARGADAFAGEWAVINWIDDLKVFQAEWDKYGKRSGGIRNQQMLDEGKPDLVIAFPTENSRGTWDMIRRAEAAGVPVRVIK